MAKGQYEKWTTEEGQLLLRGWKRAGLTDEEIADKIGINVRTIYDWKDKYPQISQALKKGKELCDFEAEEALVGLFKGHTVTETIEETETLTNGKTRTHKKTITKWVEPNPTAIIFYLKCRAGWRENTEVDNTDKDNDVVMKFVEGLKNGSDAE